VAGADERVGLARRDQFRGDPNGGAGPAPEGDRGRLVVRHCLFCVHDLERPGMAACEGSKNGRHAGLGTHEKDTDVEMTRGSERPFDHDGRGMITAHGVNGNTKHDPAADPARSDGADAAESGRNG